MLKPINEMCSRSTKRNKEEQQFNLRRFRDLVRDGYALYTLLSKLVNGYFTQEEQNIEEDW